MKIGIDARFLTHPQVGGFKTYTVNLIGALGQIDPDNQYVIYLDRPSSNGSLPQYDNFEYRVVNGTSPIIGMPLREQLKLRNHIARDKPTLVHFLCNTAPISVSAKYVVTLHDTIQVTNNQGFKLDQGLAAYKQQAITKYSRWTILRSVHAASRIITVSNYEKNQIVEQLKLDPKRVSVTHLAVNSVFAPFSASTKEGWRTKFRQKFNLPKKYILGIGYETRKNIPLLIEIFSQLAPYHSDLDLVIIAAEASARSFFQRLTAEKGIHDRVLVLPAMSAEDLSVLYNLAEILVYPSERESFGLPPLEAITCGTPTIAMNETSLPEILESGAFLIQGKDVRTWVDAIEQVLSNEKCRLELSDQGLEQSSKFSWLRCAEETIQVYKDVAREN